MKRWLCRLMLLSLGLVSVAVAQEDVLMKAMRDELSRSMARLRLADLDKPYFIAYRIDDNSTTKISATLGQLTDQDEYRGRKLAVQVRVGDFALDNTNFMNLGSGNFGGGNCGCHTTLSLDDDYDQIRREIWLETDAAYKQSAADLAAKRTVLGHRQRGQELPDFTPQPSVTVNDKPLELKADVPELQKLVRELSAAFQDSPEIISSGVDLYVISGFARYLNSEGTSFTRPERLAVLDVHAYTQANDGQQLGDAFRVYGRSMNELRNNELLARTRELIVRLKALRVANSMERYNGPVLFEGEAAAEVLGQVFAPAIVAWRFPVTDQPQFEAQFQQVINQFGGSLADRLGSRVLPDGFDLTVNPKLARVGNTELIGSYGIDNEGVPSREVKIVEHGRLVTLLANRTPTLQTKASTGSERAVGVAPGNVFLTAQKTETNDELRKELLRVAQQRGYSYGIVIRHVGAGTLSALMRMAATMSRAELAGGTAVYKVFADGHEEMVRAEIAPVPLNAFKEILAAGDKPNAYHSTFIPFAGSLLGRAGGGQAEAMSVAVSYVVPSLLFEEVSLKEPAGVAPKPPVAPSPLASAEGSRMQSGSEHATLKR